MIIELEEYKYKLIGMRKEIAELHDSLRIDELPKTVARNPPINLTQI